MAEAEFGIIDCIEPDKDYSKYEPEKYNCVSVNDCYLDDWWPKLSVMKTYFHRLSRPAFGLARYGVTLIPPESLAAFQDIILSDRRVRQDIRMVCLAELIGKALKEKKFMIHYGI